MTQNARTVAQNSPSPSDVTLRCRSCRQLLRGPSTMHGDRCPVCDTGRLEVIARVTERMVREHEEAMAP